MRKSKLGPLAEVKTRLQKQAERSATRANANDERFAETVKGFPAIPDPESLAEIQRKGDLAAAERDQRIADRRAQLKGGQ